MLSVDVVDNWVFHFTKMATGNIGLNLVHDRGNTRYTLLFEQILIGVELLI